MPLSRRAVLRSAAVAAGAIVFSGPGALARAAVRTQPTSRGSLVPGRPSPSGYRKVVAGPADPRVVRADLGVQAAKARRACRTPLLAFAQFSDTHVVDHQSPARVEWTDRLEDPSAAPALGLFSSSYRPHEMLTGQVLDAMVQAVNDQGVGPVTGLPLAFMIETGDNSDNSQYNEVRWNIDILDGASGVAVDSGAPNRYEGVMDDAPLTYDPHYYHPDGPPPGRVTDAYQAGHGFPPMPGLLDTARAPFDATGLAIGWYSCFGNHDGLMQGNFPWNSLQLDLLATGALKIISPPAGISPADLADAVTNQSLAGLLAAVQLGPGVRLVTPDPDRRSLTRGEFVEEHFATTGTPVGHGFTETNRADDTAYYYFDSGDFRFVVMDTVNPNGYYEGSLDQPQFDWLKTTVAAAADKAVVLFSHHTSASMTNPLVLTGLDPAPRVLGGAVVEFLLMQPHVIAWVNGHTHRNEIIAHQRSGGGGFWEINTAAHIDWPQQARLIEIADNGDQTWSIFTTVLDHAGPADPGPDPTTPLALAGLSREFSANEPQANLAAGGKAADRNTELLVATPPGLVGRACRAPSIAADPPKGQSGSPGKGSPGRGSNGADGAAPAPVGSTTSSSQGGRGTPVTTSPRADTLPDTGTEVPSGLVAAGLSAVLAGDVLRRVGGSETVPAPSGD